MLENLKKANTHQQLKIKWKCFMTSQVDEDAALLGYVQGAYESWAAVPAQPETEGAPKQQDRKSRLYLSRT